ncbi:MAG: hypothetical protein CM1200mP29_14320 [Verrucomicrobiota bacterium]|nr:MAG: hypothetical protein CM1200mP29_14320 [Verrucomicrobiota bacterium]
MQTRTKNVNASMPAWMTTSSNRSISSTWQALRGIAANLGGAGGSGSGDTDSIVRPSSFGDAAVVVE